jgi:cytochrome c-type biogenesis protein CcmE
VLTIAEARGAPVGTTVTITGVVIAEAGRMGLPPLLALADATGGIIVRLPEGVTAPARGTALRIKGPLADPYGQLEVRPSSSGFSVTGQGSLPAAIGIEAGDLGETTEGRLAELTGTVAAAPQKSTSGDFTVTLSDRDGRAFKVVCDASSEIPQETFQKGQSFRLTGVVGQRASRKGALDGYRLYLRDVQDVIKVAGNTGPGGASGASPVSIETALAYAEGTPAVIEGTVTASAALLDSTGRRIVVQDATGAIEVLVPSGTQAPPVGVGVRAMGATGRAYGAPRVVATKLESLGKGSSITPASLSRPPAERDEWQLVRISGTVEDVQRMGDRWRAEIVLASGGRAPVHGQAGAGIPSTAIVEGRPVTVVGIVRRPYPTATDRRFAVLPRDGRDLALGPGGSGAASSGGGSGGTGVPAGEPVAVAGASPTPGSVDITPDTDLAALADRVGERVRVGGLITSLADEGFGLDDGTAIAQVELRGAMTELRPHLRIGQAVAATGVVELADGKAIVVVDDDGALFRVGSLGQAVPVTGSPMPSVSAPPLGSESIAAGATGLVPDLAPTSLVTLAGLAALSIAATLIRRRLVQRRLRAVLVARLAGLREREAELAASASLTNGHGLEPMAGGESEPEDPAEFELPLPAADPGEPANEAWVRPPAAPG